MRMLSSASTYSSQSMSPQSTIFSSSSRTKFGGILFSDSFSFTVFFASGPGFFTTRSIIKRPRAFASAALPSESAGFTIVILRPVSGFLYTLCRKYSRGHFKKSPMDECDTHTALYLSAILEFHFLTILLQFFFQILLLYY